MRRQAKCPDCGALVEYDDASVWEGNQELEDVLCPNCKTTLDRVFTDLNPFPKVAKKDGLGHLSVINE